MGFRERFLHHRESVHCAAKAGGLANVGAHKQKELVEKAPFVTTEYYFIRGLKCIRPKIVLIILFVVRIAQMPSSGERYIDLGQSVVGPFPLVATCSRHIELGPDVFFPKTTAVRALTRSRLSDLTD